MYNLETCLSPKSSWRCFLVVISLFLLFSFCTTTKSDQKRDQLAKRMTGGEEVKHTDLFYARVYTFRKTQGKGKKGPVTEVLRTCAGTFIFVDLVLTASQCVLFKDVYGVVDKTIVHLDDFSKPQKGLIRQKTYDVLHIHENPYHNNRLIKNGLPMYDVALLRTELFSYDVWPPRFFPIPPCSKDVSKSTYQLKMLGMTKAKDLRFSILDPINDKKEEFFLNSKFIQEAQFEEVDPLQLFERVYKSKKIFIIWKIQTKRKPKPLPPHRIAAFSIQGGQMDEDKGEIGSPAFLYEEKSKMPVCLYGVLSGFISGQQSDTFPDPHQSEGVPKNVRTVTAVDLEGVFFYYKWLIEQIDEGWKRWEAKDPTTVARARKG